MIIHRNDILALNNYYVHFACNSCASNDCEYVIKVNVNGASTIFALTLCTIKWLHGHILPERKYWLAL